MRLKKPKVERIPKEQRKGSNLSVWMRESERAEVEAAAEKSMDKAGPWARKILLKAARSQLDEVKVPKSES